VRPAAAPAGRGPRSAPPSLRARALRHLARREHSRLELGRKLEPHAASAGELAELLDALESAGLLCAQRFADSLVFRRGSRFGVRRVAQELDAHGLEPAVRAEALARLRGTERERAAEAWARRFGTPPASIAERARQHRFLAQRGFAGDTIAWVLKQATAGQQRAGPDSPAPPDRPDPLDRPCPPAPAGR
jgi:regulatory protein